jgi:hypothetical protein
MESDWASDHLQVIRTLMERVAIYRRALAPTMLFTGLLGLAAAGAGLLLQINSPRGFVGYWLGVGVAALAGSLLLVRRQSLKDSEPFWSPPARRVSQAGLPALVAGWAAGVIVLLKAGPAGPLVASGLAGALVFGWLPVAWIVLYGCGCHAAGFFMPRGIKLFGWLFVVGGCLLLTAGFPEHPRPSLAHGVMGAFFGALHLAYGLYLYFTEKQRNVA